jgi:hypothetical protein
MKSMKLVILIMFLYIFVVDCVQPQLHDTDKSESRHIQHPNQIYRDIVGIFLILLPLLQISVMII